MPKTQKSPDNIHNTPQLAYSSARPAAAAADFQTLDAQVGWLVVNRWTYRGLRLLTNRVLPKVDKSGVRIEKLGNAARGMVVVHPDAPTGDGAVLLLHGGGYVMGSNEGALVHAVRLAQDAGVPVYCPAYRLAPENVFPAGLDDCHAAFYWLVDHAEDVGVDPAKIVVGGISAGGGLAAALVQRLHDEGGAIPSAQLLIYPMLDDRTAARDDLGPKQHRIWSKRNNIFGWTSYLGHPLDDTPPPYAAPARRDDVTGLPPAWVGVGSADLFLDEDRDYARRLNEAGVDVTFVEVDGGVHGFDTVLHSPLTQAFGASSASFVQRFAT